MKKTLFLVFIFALSSFNIYTQTQEGDSIAFKREKWFYIPRSSPDNIIPEDALYNAYLQKASMGPNNYIINENWINIGPSPVHDGSWYPVSGRINTIKYFDDHTIFCGPAEGGVWMAQYYYMTGTDWVNKSSDLISLSSGALAIDKISNPPIIYYGTGEGNYGFIYSYIGMGIFKSTNAGNNWTHVYGENSNLPKDLRIFRIVIRPGSNNNNQVFAATNKGLYRSVDFGETWDVIEGTQNRHCNDIVFSEQHNNIAYSSGPSRDLPSYDIQGIGFLKSTDGGETWNELAPDVPTYDFPVRRSHLDISKVDDNYLYAVTNDNGWITAFVSTDGGVSFIGRRIQNNGTQADYNLFIRVKPNDPSTAFVGGVNLFRTMDYGLSYCSITQGNSCFQNGSNMHKDFHYMDFNPDYDNKPNEMVVSCDGGAYLSTNNGVDWYGMNDDPDFSISQLYRISSGSLLLGGVQDNGLFYKNATNNGWTGVHFGGDGTLVLNSKHFPGQMWGITGNDGTVYNNCVSAIASSNFGNTWDGGNDWVGALSEHPTTKGKLYHARRNKNSEENLEIYFSRSTDYGTSWNDGLPLSILNSSYSPQNIEFSKNDPDIVYLSTSGYIGEWNNPIFGRELYKSTNGGISWLDEEPIGLASNIIPKRYITKVLTNVSNDLQNEDDVYITLSGKNGQGGGNGHIFKSSNGGYNWSDISGNLPDVPVNDIEVWESDRTQKTLLAATDVGVFGSTDYGTTWKNFAPGLPNTIAMDLEMQPIEGLLKVATFGRGVWNVTLPGDIYIKGEYVTIAPYNITKNVFVCSDSKLVFSSGSSITNIANNKKIDVEDGATFEANAVHFYGFNWDGVNFSGNSQGLLYNCEFSENSNPSIKILGNESTANYNNITIDNTRFINSGNVYIEYRENVLINNCFWQHSGINIADVWGIECVGSSDLTILKNKFNDLEPGSQNLNSTAISVIYGNNIVISQNRIFDSRDGIQISNSSVTILDNYISHEYEPGSAENGITLDNSYSSVIKNNNIIDYSTGIFLYNSSPDMYSNVIGNTNTPSTALYAGYGSSPRLRPQESIGETIWDAGKNELKALYTGNGNKYAISITNYSIPNIDMGCNTINGNSYNISGDIGLCAFLLYNYPATLNNWNNPNNNNVCDATIETSPDGCLTGGGGSFSNEENTPPPQPIIINYGNGVFDTIQISNRSIQLSADKSIYHSACRDELLNNHQIAISKYKQIIQNYQDSSTAINSLRRILHCNDKLNVDTNSYSDLRTYYQELILSNLTDTAFVNVAEELAAKCLVRMGHPTNAIDEYEVIISNTNDSAKILCAELNIIETYMIIQNSGDSPNYTGQLGYLKPMGKEDAYKKIMDRLHKGKNKKTVNQLPKEYQLSQNYPNPFNPVTKIKYALPYASNVNLKVYDILGREVISLVNEFKDAGSYIVEFNGKNYASGVYFYRFEAEGQNGRKYVERKKMVLVK